MKRQQNIISSLFNHLRERTSRGIQLSLWDRSVAGKVTKKARTATCQSDSVLLAQWNLLRAEYFPEESNLSTYRIVWSVRRQKRVLASCNIKRKLVRVANELNAPEHLHWLSPLLYHEMCHAVLDPSSIRSKGKYRWHGKEFRTLERRHPGISALDQWIKEGGWRKAVRSHRSRMAAHSRKQ